MAEMRQGSIEEREQKAGGDLGFSGLEYLTLRDYWRLLLRRRWLILSTMLVCALGVALVAFFLPNIYRASAVILVEPRKVPDTYVPSATTAAAARLTALQQEILSSTRLTQIINSVGLYADLKERKSPQEIIEIMRKDILIELFESGDENKVLGSFKISYKAHSAAQAAEVTGRLASLFIDLNTQTSERQVMGTTEFIDREVKTAEKDMAAKEAQLRDLKARYSSALPETRAAHLQAIGTFQIELREEVDAAARAQQQKIYLQSAGISLTEQTTSGPTQIETQLAQAQMQLDDLRARYGPTHPDIIKKNLEVKDLQERVAKAHQAGTATEHATPPTGGKRANPLVDSQIAALDQELRKHQQREQELKSQFAFHQSMLERIPIVDQQLSVILREYDTAREHLKALQDRKFSADMSAHLETNQKAERFVILEPVQIPQKPVQPNRPLIDLAGLVGGLAIGVSLAIVLEVMDSTVKTEREVTEQLDVPVFGEVPWCLTKRQKRSRMRRAIAAAAGNALLAIAYVVVILFTRWYR